jgi:hypothetical protein
LIGRRRRGDLGGRETDEQTGKLERVHDVVDGDLPDHVLRHVRNRGTRGILRDGDAAARLHRHHPGRAAVLVPGQHDADDARSVRLRCTAEERVDRRTVSVLLRAANDVHPSWPDEELHVGRSDVDLAALDLLLVERVTRRESTA